MAAKEGQVHSISFPEQMGKWGGDGPVAWRLEEGLGFRHSVSPLPSSACSTPALGHGHLPWESCDAYR